MRILNRTLVFRVILYTNEPRMVLQFNDLYQIGLGIDSDRFQARLAELFNVIVVEFVTMTVTLYNLCLAIGFGHFRFLVSVQG